MKKIMFTVPLVFAFFTVCSQNNDEYKRMVDTAIILQTRDSEQSAYKDGIYLIDQKDQALSFFGQRKK